MSHSVGQIGWFQLSNLRRNKVPFLLLSIGEVNLVLSKEVEHLRSSAVLLASENLDSTLKELAIPKDYPVVLVCSNDADHSRALNGLTQLGYLNIYSVPGGWMALVAEAAIS